MRGILNLTLCALALILLASTGAEATKSSNTICKRSIVTKFISYIKSLKSSSKGVINTSSAGPIYGITTSSGKEYLGVTYAQPPVDDLRYAYPVAFPKFTAVFNASAYGASCPQYSGRETSEDCLTLNVFTPSSTSSNSKLPVMVWIHGGSFLVGGSSDAAFDGSNLASEGVIVVTLNYRLGLLGFFDGLGTNGNMGTLDVQMALKWVQNNIAAFGGNADKVTVFGQSSGGHMIRALMSSSASEGLFDRAIIQSDPQNYGLQSRNVSADIIGAIASSYLDCSDIACMRNASIDDILNAQAAIQQQAPYLVAASTGVALAEPISPAIDGSVIIGDFSALAAAGNLPVNVDMIMGTVHDEANPTIEAQLPYPGVSSDYFAQVAVAVMGQDRAIQVLYSGLYNPDDSSDGVREALAKLGTEFIWTCPTQANAVTLSSGRNVYLYEFEKGITYTPDNGSLSLCTSSDVCHEDDLYLTFGTYTSATSSQKKLSAEVMDRWVAFAKTGNPNVNGYKTWSPVKSAKKLNAYLLGDAKVNQTLRATDCSFLQSVGFDYSIFS
ncbi:hypothetical protein YB2330_002854 [Saitoella coloradoensis]